jgi:hypothetical protein
VPLSGRQQLLAAPLATRSASVADGAVGVSSLSPSSCAPGQLFVHEAQAWACDNQLPQLTVTQTLNAATINAQELSATIKAPFGGPNAAHVEPIQAAGANAGYGFFAPAGLGSFGVPVYWSIHSGGFNSANLRLIISQHFDGGSQSSPDDKLSIDNNGNVFARGTFVPNSSPDLAETIAAAADVEAGDVVCADPERAEHVVRCGRGQRLLGVISDGTGGFLINTRGHSVDGRLTGKPLVLAGRVPVKVSLENGPIHIGDLLAPSSRPGVAMRATAPGPVVGIALDKFDHQNGGTVLCFVKVEEGNLVATLTELAAQHEALAQRVEILSRVLVREHAANRDLPLLERLLVELEALASR